MSENEKPIWKALPFAPAGTSAPKFRHKTHGTPAAIYTYQNAHGLLAGIVCRFDLSDGRSEKISLAYCESDGGKTTWRQAAIPEPRPPFGLAHLTDSFAVITESEESAEALTNAGIPAAAFAGGPRESDKSDTSVLVGKICIVWASVGQNEIVSALAPVASEIRIVRHQGKSAADTDPDKFTAFTDMAAPLNLADYQKRESSQTPQAKLSQAGTSGAEPYAPVITASQWQEIERRIQMAGGSYRENVFAAELKRLLPMILTTGKDWRVFNDSHWEKIAGPERFLPLALELLAHFNYNTARHASDIVSHVGASCQTTQKWRGAYTFDDKGAVLLNLANGILRVSESQIGLGPHDWTQGFTATIPTPWVAGAECPAFIATLNDAMPDADDRELFRLFAGSILEPSARLEAGLAVFGPSGTGKSTLIDAGIADAIGGPPPGAGTVSRVSLRQLCDPKSYSLPGLENSMVNIITEGDALEVEESGNFKSIISGEPIECREIYGKPRIIVTTAKLLLATNSLPRFRNGTDAEGRRLRLLNFDQVPTSPDPELKHRIHDESAGILRWMAEALQDVLGLRNMPRGGASAKRVTNRFALSNDSLGCFITELCTLDPSGHVSRDELLAAFNEFADNHGFSPDNHVWFFRKLFDRFPHLQSRKRFGIRSICGITFKTEHPPDDGQGKREEQQNFNSL